MLVTENIDDELDGHGMLFVKIDNDEEAKEYGFEELPVLVGARNFHIFTIRPVASEVN